ncbi:hypothetical protein EMCRGX_G019798 [Ephydatia muelleri]
MAEIEETVDDGSDCDDLVEEAYTYLVSKKYPECVSETKKRVIRRKAAKLTISVEGELLYKHKQGKEKSLEERQKILLACHIDSTSGHMGKTRTLYRIKERFMWHGMVKDVVSLLSKCDVCQRMNRKLTTGVPELHPIPVKAPWYMVGIDFIGTLSPVAKDGSRYILTISDYFTKWVEVVPTVNKMASTVASSLFKIFMRMGLPRVLLSDNGSEFCNALNDQLSEMLGIKRRLTTPYHPQANGLDERFNQTLQNMLVKYVSSKKDMWSHYLDTCAFAYNTSRHDSTKYTPFMLMFGRRATLPIDVELERQCSEDLCKTYWELDEHPYPAVFSEHARILEEAKGNIIAAQLRQKEAYDKKHCKPDQFQCDQLVLLRNFSRKKVKGGKLTERFLGPYTIINVLPNRVYEIRNEEGKTTRATGSHLKMYMSSDACCMEDEDEDQSSSQGDCVTPSGTLASPHSSEDDSDCHKGGQSKDHSSSCNRAHQNDCVEVGGIDSGCTVLEDCSVSVKRDTIRKRKCPFTRKMKKQVVGGEWLTDDHMFYAQELLRMQFPTIDGWQSTLLAQNNGYLPAKMDAIQIHIVSDSHWVTSARLGGTVTLFDCPVNVATVQKQRGSDDCGVFAIAFALHAALGHCLEEIEFDQATMRDHLLKCYTTRNFTPFPTKKVKRARHTLIMNIDVFCSCQMPDTYGDMVQCGLCKQWFHIKCVGLHSLPSSAEKWNCSLCT